MSRPLCTDLARRFLVTLLAVTLAAVAPPPVLAQPSPAGRFIAVVGDVRVIDRAGVSRVAAQGGDVREGDTVVTGSGALGQLRMADGSLISVREGSEMKFDQFSYAGENDANASMFVSLVVGGFRALTGLISKLNKNAVKVTTPSATIGIRGTDFEPVFVPPPAPGQPRVADPGAYVRVYSGEVALQNQRGLTQVVLPNQIAFAAVTGDRPVLLPVIPTQIFRAPTPLPKPPAQTQREEGTGSGPRAVGGAVPRPALKGLPGAVDGERPALSTPGGALPRDAVRGVAPAEGSAPLLISPIETRPTLTAPTTTLQPAPGTTTILQSPTTTTIQTAPTTTLQSPTPTIQTAPTTTLEPAPTILQSPTTTILQSPTTTTIQPAPTTTLQSPTTTTIQTAPTTTLQSPTTTTIQTAPTTTLQSPTTISPTIKP